MASNESDDKPKLQYIYYDENETETDMDTDIETIEEIKPPKPMKPIEPMEPIESIDLRELYDPSTKKWSRRITEIKTRDLNKYFKMYDLTKDEIKSLKTQRRRMLNCSYARISRKRKRDQKQINSFSQ